MRSQHPAAVSPCPIPDLFGPRIKRFKPHIPPRHAPRTVEVVDSESDAEAPSPAKAGAEAEAGRHGAASTSLINFHPPNQGAGFEEAQTGPSLARNEQEEEDADGTLLVLDRCAEGDPNMFYLFPA